ncbi:MAG: hypothetical protein SH857_01800 [Chitinophagales bacterium]|nr:hypothetical protein [Chitinophagales bacterium]
MLKAIATFFSVLFHPLFFPTYAILFVNWVSPYQLAGLDQPSKLKLFATIILNTTFFPLMTVFIMKKLGMVKSIFLREREERIIPLIAIGMFYFWSFVVIKNLEINTFITTLFLGASIAVFACFFLNLFFKISIHTIGAGAFFAMALLLAFASSYNLEVPILVILIFAGLLGSSRWYLGEHGGVEIFSGYVVGFLSQMVALKFVA